MFKWLADLLVKTPVQSSCSCCEGKKQRLQKMQEAIERGEIAEDSPEINEEVIINCDSPEHEYVGKIFGTYIADGYPFVVGDYKASDYGSEDCDCPNKDCQEK